ncbi:hypothetical protein J1614_007437 [Plenodomus biglobosus]|nr:hypothetical protein J1614_007437 [Plenodomus biglobosus]
MEPTFPILLAIVPTTKGGCKGRASQETKQKSGGGRRAQIGLLGMEFQPGRLIACHPFGLHLTTTSSRCVSPGSQSYLASSNLHATATITPPSVTVQYCRFKDPTNAESPPASPVRVSTGTKLFTVSQSSRTVTLDFASPCIDTRLCHVTATL